MKKTSNKNRSNEHGEMRPEYQFDYKKSRSNRFADNERKRTVVVLEPDISKVFTTPESVNKALRATISAMPTTKSKPGRETPQK